MDNKKIKKIMKITAAFLLALSLCSCGGSKEEVIELDEAVEEIEEDSDINKEDDTASNDLEYAYVHVCGSVNNPGVYRLLTSARVYEAIEAAGGACGDGCPDMINQARAITDGEQIYVPCKEEVENGVISIPGADAAGDGMININTSSKEELMTLPGIGESKAESIVNHRESNGNFNDINDLMNVEGIKEGVFNKIKDKIKT